MEVRALLESAPYAITLRQAPVDYRDQTGCELPFRRLGFNSAEELFRSMPDTVFITPSIKGPVLKSVANASTQHVERMVRTQRKAPSRGFQVPKEAPIGPRPAGYKEETGMRSSVLGPGSHFNLGRMQQATYNRNISPPPTPNNRPPPLLPFPPNPYYSHPGNYPPPIHPAYHPYMQPRPMFPPFQQFPYKENHLPGPFGMPVRQPIPAYIKCHVQQLMLNNANGLSTEVFAMLFRETFKYMINFEQLGYSNIYDFILAMPEIATLKNCGSYLQIMPPRFAPPKRPKTPTQPVVVVEERHVAESKPDLLAGTVESRKSPECPKAPSEAVLPERPASPVAKVQQPPATEPDPPRSPLPPPSMSSGGPTAPVIVPTNSGLSSVDQGCDLASVKAETSPTANSSIRSPSLIVPAEYPEPVRHKKKSSKSETLSNAISDKMKETFQQILDVNPNGIWASELMPKYQKLTKCRLDFREFGFYSIMEMVVAIPDIFLIKKSKKKGDYLLLPACCKVEEAPDSGMETLSRSSSPKDHKNHSTTADISLQLKRKLMQVICSCPSGVVLAEFENIYRVFHDESLNLDSLKPYTAEALFLSLRDIILLDYVDDKTIYVKATPEGKKLLDTPLPKPEKFRLGSLQKATAEDAVVTVQSFKWQSLPQLSPGKKYIEVYVTYLVNPGKFWIQLRGMDTSVALDELMNSLRLIYYHPVLSNRYVMPDELITIGFVCAALYPADQNWHRAIITGVNTEGTVNVLYVDFGNETTVLKTALRLLKREYLKLPAQAIKAKLANIIPIRGVSNEWTSASIRRFKELCLNHPLVASVLDTDNTQLSLCLYDTSGENDIRINDTLVSENHATLSIFQPQVAQANALLGRSTDLTAAELRTSVGSYISGKDLELGASFSQGKQSPCSPGHASGSRSSSSEAAALPSSFGISIPNQSELQLEKDSFNITEAPLMEHTFHVVRLDGDDFIPTFEVSELFWKSDVLRRMVRLTPLSVDFCIIDKASRPALHKELLKLQKAKVANDSNVALCPLNRIPDILPLFMSSHSELLQAFVDLVKLRGS